jgi:hypothetical protein
MIVIMMTTTKKSSSALTIVLMSLRHRLSVLSLHISRSWCCESGGVQVSHKNRASHENVLRSVNALNPRLLTFENNCFLRAYHFVLFSYTLKTMKLPSSN